jgi:hypothetical protein
LNASGKASAPAFHCGKSAHQTRSLERR